MSVQEICRVAENTQLGDGLFLMVLHAPKITELAQCGQFVHIACGEGHLLRRPISICAWKAPELRIVFQVKGEGTKWLSERRTGDELDVLGPLGHGFDVGALGSAPVFIGGGIGVPPMLGCVREAVKQGAKPAAILGFRNQSAVILEGDFRDECETFVTTDDGSYARHGFVTDVLKEQIASASGVAACGPKPMLKAIAAIAPAKAAMMRVAEPVSSPLCRKTTIVRATASFAPLDTPMTKGPAMGLAKKVCKR